MAINYSAKSRFFEKLHIYNQTPEMIEAAQRAKQQSQYNRQQIRQAEEDPEGYYRDHILPNQYQQVAYDIQQQRTTRNASSKELELLSCLEEKHLKSHYAISPAEQLLLNYAANGGPTGSVSTMLRQSCLLTKEAPVIEQPQLVRNQSQTFSRQQPKRTADPAETAQQFFENQSLKMSLQVLDDQQHQQKDMLDQLMRQVQTFQEQRLRIDQVNGGIKAKFEGAQGAIRNLLDEQFK